MVEVVSSEIFNSCPLKVKFLKYRLVRIGGDMSLLNKFHCQQEKNPVFPVELFLTCESVVVVW